jgi:anthraniloyl-CoA monooxygenase
VWRAAGPTRWTRTSLAFCEQLFANELRGRELFSNRSLWLDFPKVTNESWLRNVVILGDAAHTAHFSIGSGTKLAMGTRSRSLRASSGAVGTSPPRSSTTSSSVGRSSSGRRRPRARAPRTSGRIASYSHLEPIQFAFNLITRAGRITHATLGVRDPQFTRALDSWLGGAGCSPPPAFSPFELRGVKFENRFELVQHGCGERGGADVFGGRRPTRGQDPASPHSCRSRGATQPRVGASTSCWPTAGRWWRPPGVLRAFRCDSRRPDEDDVLDAFVAAASNARAEVLEIDMAHGFLLGSFLSPLTNDEEDRLRFPVRVFDAVRSLDRAIAVRLSVTDWHPRGNKVEDGIEIARSSRHGCDLIHVEAGQTIHDDRPQYRRGFLTALSDRVRNEARVPTIVGGY